MVGGPLKVDGGLLICCRNHSDCDVSGCEVLPQCGPDDLAIRRVVFDYSDTGRVVEFGVHSNWHESRWCGSECWAATLPDSVDIEFLSFDSVIDNGGCSSELTAICLSGRRLAVRYRTLGRVCVTEYDLTAGSKWCCHLGSTWLIA